MMPEGKSQSYGWHIPFFIVLSLGYLIGGRLVFGVHFLNAFPQLTDKTAGNISEKLFPPFESLIVGGRT
jgi:hypothetical protein